MSAMATQQAASPAGSADDRVASGGPPAAATPPFRGLGFTLSTLGFAVAQGFRERLAPLGIEPRDFALLRAVGAAEGLCQQEIGDRLRVPPSRMVALIDSMQERGLLERRAHPTDRRARALYLTAEGGALLERSLAAAVSFETELCSDLDPAERQRLLELLGTVAATLGLPPGVHASNLVPEAAGA
jgi:DNA-binding MarR family transcriptional regulator